jgi:hypothetical protein
MPRILIEPINHQVTIHKEQTVYLIDCVRPAEILDYEPPDFILNNHPGHISLINAAAIVPNHTTIYAQPIIVSDKFKDSIMVNSFRRSVPCKNKELLQIYIFVLVQIFLTSSPCKFPSNP